MKKKKIYITEDVANNIQTISNPIKELPKDIKNVIKNHKTSLGIHPSFPPEEELPFDALIIQERFKEVTENISKLKLDNYSTIYLQKYLQELVDECKNIEKDFKEQLENICYNYIIDLFQVPEGLVSFECKIVDTINPDKPNIILNNDFVFNNINHKNTLQDAVYKRRMINAIITGGSSRLSKFSKALIGELYELSPDLPLLYKKITTINEYLLFTKNNIGISKNKKKLLGFSILTIGNERVKNDILVEAELFPILLFESIKGFLEMFASYGLPSSMKDASYILSKADNITFEPWDMRLGPQLWDILMNAFNHPDSKKIPLILTILFSQRTKKFNIFLQEIFGKTKKSKIITTKILKKVERDIEYDDFEETMYKKQTDTTIIKDSYFLPEEL